VPVSVDAFPSGVAAFIHANQRLVYIAATLVNSQYIFHGTDKSNIVFQNTPFFGSG
jgi:hypothetical protein